MMLSSGLAGGFMLRPHRQKIKRDLLCSDFYEMLFFNLSRKQHL
jgi:hypothetical protein